MKILTTAILMLSLFVINIPTVQAESETRMETSQEHLPAHLLYESQDLGAFTKLKLDLVSSYVEVQKGEDYKLAVYISQEDLAFEDVFSLSTEDQQLILNEKDWINNVKSFLTTLTSRVVITVPKTEDLSLEVDVVNGEVKVAGTLAAFKFDGPNVNIFLSGKETYPIAIDIVNGDIELVFEKYDADLDLEFVNGRFDILGDQMSATLSDYQKTLGEGRDDIQIDAVNGKVIIREAE